MIKYFIGDSIEILKNISNVHLVITSPPYNVGMEYEVDLTIDEYEKMLVKVYTACYNSMVENSRICINVPPNMFHGKNKDIFNPYFINYNALIKSGFKYRDTIIWNQLHSGNKTSWGSWLSPSSPWIRHQTEFILLMYKGSWKLNREGISDLTKNEFLSCVDDIWPISPARRKINGHPAPFPEELPIKCIKFLSYVGDLVLDPFLGSGTTLKACRITNRNGIGIEINSKYEHEIIENSLINVVTL